MLELIIPSVFADGRGHVSDSLVFSEHLIHVSFSSVFNTCVRGDVLTVHLVNTHVSVLWLGVNTAIHAAFM